MKKHLLLVLSLVIASLTTMAQQEYYEVNTAPDVRTKAYRPNQVIVKFKTDGAVAVKKNAQGRFKTASVSAVDNVLQKYGVQDADQLMPLTGKLPANAPRKVKGYNGKEFELKDLSKLYCLKLENLENLEILEVVEELNALDEVEFAEPNYLVYLTSQSTFGISPLAATPNPLALQGEGWGEDDPLALQGEGWGEDDPLYSQQWGIPAINLPQLWEKPLITDKRPVIAILDTGVEIAHPDLAANIWTNAAEVEGSSKYDDDQNGFADDLHGWDFVNQTGYIDDYNGHGTHCAGIAAAAGGNGKGIVGANPDALIMPVTVMQSDGTGDIATIIRGIDYAAANGADVISMSFGGYSYSIAEEQALARAYSRAVLVAAAGNDGMCIYPHRCPPPNGQLGSPMFPAAFTFVLGVQATANGGAMAGFSNYDEDGPIYFNSQYFSEEQMYNYELKAPGTSVISTFSNGSYKALNGTSMACPLVAGAVSRLLQTKEYPTKELLFGDLIHAANGGNVDMAATYDITDADRKPNLSLVSWRIEDEKDNDGRFDAGEAIKFYPMLRNDWGTAENIQVWMEMGDQESHSILSFTQAMVSSDKPLSSYAKAEMETPIEFTLADNVTDGRHIRLVLYAQCDGMDEPTAQEITITAENGVEIGGMIDHDMILEEGVNYIVSRTIAVPDGVTLTIAPGAVLKFTDGTGISTSVNGEMSEVGKVYAIGTPERPITFTKRDQDLLPSVKFRGKALNYSPLDRTTSIIFENVNFSNLDLYVGVNGVLLRSCRLFDNSLMCGFSESGVVNCVIDDNTSSYSLDNAGNAWVNNNFIANKVYIESTCSALVSHTEILGDNFIGNWDTNRDNVIALTTGGASVGITSYPFPSYFGTSLESTARNGILDIESGYGAHKIDLSNMLTQPNPEAHGVVWKVLVNGYDAQDEFDQLPPLGVGRHKFEVWYSKKIDETIAPTIAMGVRPPYTQTAIAEDGSWRTESVVFDKFGGKIPEVKNVVNGYFETGGTDGWNLKILGVESNIYNYVSSRTGYSGERFYMYGGRSQNSCFAAKVFQRIAPTQNGIYKLRIKASVETLAENNNCQYVYANEDKVYLTSTEPTIYEVLTTVTNNEIEVGFVQSEEVSKWAEFGEVSLELIKELPNIKDLDVSVYTAYLDIKGSMAIDGLNRIYVNGGHDLEYFDIPREDTRFNVEVSAAGSMSTGFFGEAGIGKVTLTWEEQDENVDDILGYNMYRFSERETTEYRYDSEHGWGYYPTTVVDTVKVNQRLLTETEFVDYDVVPGTTYNYFYKIMRTSLTENSPSRVVAVTPVTASKGDANGSMTVDVADVVTEVSYLTGQNPQPFLFEAADVNSDEQINILDIVGTINIIVNPASAGTASLGEAVYTIEDGVLYVETPVALGGIQVTLKDSKDLKVLNALKDFEIVTSDGLFLAYSMSGKTLAPGKHALLQLGEAEIESIVLSDARGHNVEAVAGEATAIATVKAEKTAIGVPSGNTIPYYINEAGKHSVRIAIYDALGRIQHVWNGTADSGKHSYTWNGGKQCKGIYFAVLKVDGKYIGTAKMVKQ